MFLTLSTRVPRGEGDRLRIFCAAAAADRRRSPPEHKKGVLADRFARSPLPQMEPFVAAKLIHPKDG
jgi:hypothetical protein